MRRCDPAFYTRWGRPTGIDFIQARAQTQLWSMRVPHSGVHAKPGTSICVLRAHARITRPGHEAPWPWRPPALVAHLSHDSSFQNTKG